MHVTILTSTEDGTVDPGIVTNGNIDILHVGLSVEENTLITLARTVEVTDYRLRFNLCQGAWHTDGTARHDDLAVSLHVGQLITTIYARQDMSAGDFHFCTTLLTADAAYFAGRVKPSV